MILSVSNLGRFSRKCFKQDILKKLNLEDAPSSCAFAIESSGGVFFVPAIPPEPITLFYYRRQASSKAYSLTGIEFRRRMEGCEIVQRSISHVKGIGVDHVGTEW